MPNVAVYIVAASSLFFVTSMVMLLLRFRRTEAALAQELARHRTPEPAPATEPRRIKERRSKEPDAASDEPEEREEQPQNRPLKRPVVVPAPEGEFTRRAGTAMRKLGYDVTTNQQRALPAVAQMEPSLLKDGAERKASLDAWLPDPRDERHRRPETEPKYDTWVPEPRDHSADARPRPRPATDVTVRPRPATDVTARPKTEAERRASLLNLGR